MSLTIWTFVITLALITMSGAMAWVRKRETPEDYLVASRQVKPWLAALSTVATNNSGFMFIGMIGFTYQFGVEAFWLMAAWILGDLTGWIFVNPRVRRRSEAVKANTLSSLIGTWDGKVHRPVVVACGAVTFLFLGVYAAGQLKAGSTALTALFGWDMYVGSLIAAGIVVLYSYAGGVRADIWTDAAQSFAMIGAMILILVAGNLEVGGWTALMEALRAQDPQLASWTPHATELTLLGFVLGYYFGGFTMTGQPHLMARMIAIESVSAVRTARLYYFAWYVPFFLCSIGVGLYSRAIIPDIASLAVAEGMTSPTELALPLIAERLLPDVLVGIALAGLFAATISTADSQVIVCSGAVTQEIQPRWKDSYLASKLSTLALAAMALAIALLAPEGVFGLVLIAWSALGASFGPLLLIRVYDLPLSTGAALGMIAAALITVSLWHLSPWNDDVFKALPGVLAAGLVYAGWRRRAAPSRAGAETG
ncbi:MAG TPA: sodium/proline symporter [Paracoccaceae bacterium]|nr:sodium/proline symporter [Paracoccaceae bacterium]